MYTRTEVKRRESTDKHVEYYVSNRNCKDLADLLYYNNYVDTISIRALRALIYNKIYSVQQLIEYLQECETVEGQILKLKQFRNMGDVAAWHVVTCLGAKMKRPHTKYTKKKKLDKVSLAECTKIEYNRRLEVMTEALGNKEFIEAMYKGEKYDFQIILVMNNAGINSIHSLEEYLKGCETEEDKIAKLSLLHNIGEMKAMRILERLAEYKHNQTV